MCADVNITVIVGLKGVYSVRGDAAVPCVINFECGAVKLYQSGTVSPDPEIPPSVEIEAVDVVIGKVAVLPVVNRPDSIIGASESFGSGHPDPSVAVDDEIEDIIIGDTRVRLVDHRPGLSVIFYEALTVRREPLIAAGIDDYLVDRVHRKW